MEHNTTIASPSTPDPAMNLSNAPKTGYSLRIIALLSLFIAIILILVMGVAWKRFFVVQKQLTYVEKQLIQHKKATQNLQQQITQVQTRLAQQQENVAQLDKGLQRMLRQFPHSATLPTLLEIEHLLREAQLNLTYRYNIPAAINLLQVADGRIKTLTFLDTSLLRKQLVSDITILQMLPMADIEGILAKLMGLQAQIEQTLYYQIPKDAATASSSAVSESAPQHDWRTGLQATWQMLQKMIVIRHHTAPVEPLKAPEQYLYGKQYLQLYLQQAALAVQQRQDNVYQASLQQALHLVQHYYTANSVASAGISKVVRDLQQITLKPAVPDLTLLLDRLERIRQQEVQQILKSKLNRAVPQQKAQ